MLISWVFSLFDFRIRVGDSLAMNRVFSSMSYFLHRLFYERALKYKFQISSIMMLLG